jgi:hypothetical protein
LPVTTTDFTAYAAQSAAAIMSSSDPPILEEPNNPPGIISSITNTPTTTASDGGISKATSRERLQALNLFPSASIQPRPFSNKYFFKRPRLLQYYAQRTLADSHGRRREPSLWGSLLVRRKTSNAGADACEEPRGGSEKKGMGHGAEEQQKGDGDPEDGKVKSGELVGDLFALLSMRAGACHWGMRHQLTLAPHRLAEPLHRPSLVGIVNDVSEIFTSTAFEPGNSWVYTLLEFVVLFFTSFQF